MIIDVHAHLWHQERDISDPFLGEAARSRGGVLDLTTRWDRYRESAPADTVAIVFGGKARRSGLWVADEEVAQFAAAHPSEVVGFLSLDPTQPGWRDELRSGHSHLGLRGIKLMPMYAGFDPRERSLDDLWRYAADHSMPVLSHTGTTFVSNSVLDYAHPGLYDEVARRHPDLTLILAHMGHPFEGECLATIRKHPHVYADISALHYRPFQFWHALRLAQDYGVLDKLLFGSDFPFTTVNATVDGLRRLYDVGIPGLDRLDVDAVERIIARPALELLGLRV